MKVSDLEIAIASPCFASLFYLNNPFEQLQGFSIVKLVAQMPVASEREELIALRAEKIRLQSQVGNSNSFYR